MQFLDLTFDHSAMNLALDEALLEEAEGVLDHPEVLRIWESASPLVICGRSSPVETEVNLDYCRERGIEVFRRCSGGASIVTGPGCLMYAVLLDYRRRPELQSLDVAHRFVMTQNRSALQSIGIDAQLEGISDLTLGGQKFSGNSMRRKRNWMLYHGTILYAFDVQLITSCLGTPVRQPDYRAGRGHEEFVTVIPREREAILEALRKQWGATEPMQNWPQDATSELTKKYQRPDWTYRIQTAPK